MSRAKPPVTPEVIEQHLAEIANHRESLLEMTYGQFHDRTIDTADRERHGAGDLMRDLNRFFSVCHGLGTVMRIASGNDVLSDSYDPDDPNCAAPLSSAAINSLTTMAATLCEWIADDISCTADRFNSRGVQS